MNAEISNCQTLRLVLGDQLNRFHPWFSSQDSDVLYVFAELHQEAHYARHHIQKVVAFFAAMSAFAEELEARGHRVLYLDLNHTAGDADLDSLLRRLLLETGARRFEYQRPDEWRLLCQLERFCCDINVETLMHCTHHFLVPFPELKNVCPPDKRRRMEHFYRQIRKSNGWLMESKDTPVGGRWNFDLDNRKSWPAGVEPPDPLDFRNPVAREKARIKRYKLPVTGRLEKDTLIWPVNRSQAKQALDHFVNTALPSFGFSQDAMIKRSWSLSHSLLSFALNTKMISPREVVEAAIQAWRVDPERIPLSSVEGFVRQVAGWREFVRAVYWTRMPAYRECNSLGHAGALPAWFWTGKTNMACMAHAISQSLDKAYAHHIQRLMVTGNFCLLAGIDPDEVDEWYLGIYIDAIEWVELPNTRGMSQFADGGVIASKPYAASGNYINRMSDYCSDCAYQVKQREGQKSCPFNSLYWHFMVRHRDLLDSNPRIAMIYRNWDRMNSERQDAILQSANHYLSNLETL